jgi:hypothetical protein
VRAALALLTCAANDADTSAAKRCARNVHRCISTLRSLTSPPLLPFCRSAFKALYPGDAADAKRVSAFVERRAAAGSEPGAASAAAAGAAAAAAGAAGAGRLTFLAAARLIFGAKLSGTLSKPQLAAGRKALATLELASRLAGREPSLSALVAAAVGLLPQRFSDGGGGGGGVGAYGGESKAPRNEAAEERPLMQARTLRGHAPACALVRIIRITLIFRICFFCVCAGAAG